MRYKILNFQFTNYNNNNKIQYIFIKRERKRCIIGMHNSIIYSISFLKCKNYKITQLTLIYCHIFILFIYCFIFKSFNTSKLLSNFSCYLISLKFKYKNQNAFIYTIIPKINAIKQISYL